LTGQEDGVSEETYRFRVGNLECIAIKDQDSFGAEDLFLVDQAVLDMELGQRGLVLSELEVGYNCLLVDTGEHRVLVDVGWGQGVPDRQGSVTRNLATLGIEPKEIDWIVFTHEDGDHILGLVDPDGVPVYPNARCVMWKEGWEHFLATDWEERPDEIAAIGNLILPVLEERGEFIDVGVEFLPGFRLIPSTGHRPGHTVVEISSEGEKLLNLGDAIVLPIQVEFPEWAMVFDSLPDEAEVDRRRLLDLAAAEGAQVFAFHFPFPAVGSIERRGEGYVWHPVGAQ
jgi:glyoxylase-like metal-dependent hydrolase (beta-lactamase superfamily II)